MLWFRIVPTGKLRGVGSGVADQDTKNNLILGAGDICIVLTNVQFSSLFALSHTSSGALFAILLMRSSYIEIMLLFFTVHLKFLVASKDELF